MSLLIRGGTVVDEQGERRADVLIEGEHIAAVEPTIGEPPGAPVIDAGGAYVIPGAIDVHTHLDLPVGAVRSADDFSSGTLSAACGGTTCVLDFAGAGREPWSEALATWHDRANGRAIVDYGFHLTVTELPESVEAAGARFEEFIRRGVTSVKLYMAYPERLMVDDGVLARALAASVETGTLVCVHAEDGPEIERLAAAALERGETGPSALPSVHPPRVEAVAIERAAELALAAGAALYVVHLSSDPGLRAVRAARVAGARIVAETCPQYLYLDQADLVDPDFVCSPPVRHGADRQALWHALASAEIQVVSTDHCPFTSVDRRHGTDPTAGAWRSFAEIPGGLPGLETRLSLVYQGVREGRLTLQRWVEVVAGAPSRLFGLADRKGSVRSGLDADLVVFDPGATRRLSARTLHSRSDHCPYEGMEVVGWPALTLSRGRVVAQQGEPAAEAQAGWGRFVPRRASGRRRRSRS